MTNLPLQPRLRYRRSSFQRDPINWILTQNVVIKPEKPTQRHPSKAMPIINATPTPGNNGNCLAQFIKDRCWAKVFIPSLMHALYVSQEPFKDFAADSPVFITTVQTIFDKVFSDANVILSIRDSINTTIWRPLLIQTDVGIDSYWPGLQPHQKSMIQARKCHCRFHKKYFKSLGFNGEPANIQEYVWWALQPGGPAYYAKPTLKDCKVALNHPDFVVSDLPLSVKLHTHDAIDTWGFSGITIHHAICGATHQTRFLILPLVRRTCWKVFTLWSWFRYDSILYFLLLSSIFLSQKVEWGFTTHINGGFTAPPHFNHNNCWRPLQDFLKNIEKIKESQWKAVLQFHRDNEDKAVDNEYDKEANKSMISVYHVGMYIPSSPLKPWTRFQCTTKSTP